MYTSGSSELLLLSTNVYLYSKYLLVFEKCKQRINENIAEYKYFNTIIKKKTQPLTRIANYKKLFKCKGHSRCGSIAKNLRIKTNLQTLNTIFYLKCLDFSYFNWGFDEKISKIYNFVNPSSWIFNRKKIHLYKTRPNALTLNALIIKIFNFILFTDDDKNVGLEPVHHLWNYNWIGL